MTHPKQLEDTLDCGSPRDTWEAMAKHLRVRASSARAIALSLEQDAKDATEQASEHYKAAEDFDALAAALENAPVTFAAQPVFQP